MKFGTLNAYSLLKISGADAATFLQGQLTNDLNLLDNQWQFSGYCNPKGRLLALLQLWKTNSNEFSVLLSKDLTESVVKRLRMYVMRSKVEIVVTDKAISGFNSIEDIVAQHPKFEGKINQEINQSVSVLDGNQTILKVIDRYLMIGDKTDAIPSFNLDWQKQNILDGLPQIHAETAELFIPQMVNLDLLDGINFKKGCYTGQEIIARMHYLGKVKQRMFVCQIDGEIDNFKDGEKVYNNLPSDKEERKTVGNIISAVKQNDKLLAVIKLDYINNNLYLEAGQKINILDSQPYSVPT